MIATEDAMPWVGLYVAVPGASLACTLAMAANTFQGLRKWKLWRNMDSQAKYVSPQEKYASPQAKYARSQAKYAIFQQQYQNEVNDIRAERIAKSANPLALLAAAQPYSDNYYQAPKPQRSNATSSSTRPSASTRHKGKEIAKPVTPQSESVSEEDSDPEQAQRDKDMQKNLALLAKYFKRLYKPTNNNLRTSSNSRNKTEDTTPRYNNDNQSRQFGNQRTMTVAGTRETIGSPVVQQTGIQCFNCKGFGHYAKECRKPKRVKDYTYHKEKMMMCKQAEQGVPLQAEQADWLADTDEEIDEQELEAHYSFMAKIQRYLNDVNARTKKPKVVSISASKPKRKTKKYVATPHKKTVASDTTIQKSKSYYKELYENTNQEWKWKSTCFVRDLQGNDLLTGNRGSDIYIISLQETTSSTPICFMDKASPTQAWLWHQRLSPLNFDYITLLSKKDIMTGLPKLKYVKDKLCLSCEAEFASHGCGPMRVASINGKKYILVIVDDYSRYTWTLFLLSKDETPEVLKDFLTMIQRNLQAQVISVRTDRGTEFLNKTLHAYFKEEGIEHQTSTPRTPEQNGVVERRNRTLVEAARTMLSASKLPLSFWAEAVATACYTQNRSIIISTHGKTAYHIINDRKPSIKHLHIFGCICYITRDGENLDKMKEKGDPCVMVGYST
ncbi:retrovirus-related pol polyprotein from transposon TNT 1-94 [Tanacetum coccineum]|uniref:Retrovirus-related pol polyprotein from transposon TNT 1-94 n=1 Tax=Tanacetum coccineum TaxID=301880 RepID=A0ABQ4ZKH1_9ASTR